MKPSWTTSLLVASLLSCAGACTTHVGVGPLDEETGNARQDNEGILTDGSGDGDGDDSSKDDAGVSEEPKDDDEGSEEATSEEPEEPAQDACDGVGTAAYEVLSARCAGCHGGFPGMGSFSDVLDAELLVYNEKVAPNDPESSRVYIRMDGGGMPPVGPVPAEELETVKAWIECGAPALSAP